MPSNRFGSRLLAYVDILGWSDLISRKRTSEIQRTINAGLFILEANVQAEGARKGLFLRSGYKNGTTVTTGFFSDSRRRRSEIASLAGTARAKALPATKRQELARHAALARWARRSAILTAQDAPESVRRLLKTYDPASLSWNRPDDRYAVVREILVRGSDEAKGWLRSVRGPRQVRELVREYRGAGCTEPERRKLRDDLGLTIEDLPVRPYLGFQWRPRA